MTASKKKKKKKKKNIEDECGVMTVHKRLSRDNVCMILVYGLKHYVYTTCPRLYDTIHISDSYFGERVCI